MTPTVEPYRMVEPQTMTNEDLRDLFGYRREPTLRQVLWFSAKYLFWMCATYFVIRAALIIW